MVTDVASVAVWNWVRLSMAGDESSTSYRTITVINRVTVTVLHLHPVVALCSGAEVIMRS